MNVALGKALAALLATTMLFASSVRPFRTSRTVPAFVQLFGAACLVVVALTHVAEAAHLFPWMRWGQTDSAGHYLDLLSAVGGVTLFPLGVLLRARCRA